MKVNIFYLSLLAVMMPLSYNIKPVEAACAMVDVSTQVSVRGSYNPSQQNNNVNMESGEHCLGNVTSSTSTQVYVGSDNVQQTRNSDHQVGGTSPSNLNIKTPVISVPVEIQVDVYSPAHDPTFLDK